MIGIYFIGLLVIWAGYGFETDAVLAEAMRIEEKLDFIDTAALKWPVFGSNTSSVLRYALLKVPVPIPSFILGTLGVIGHGAEGHRSFLLGNWSGCGSRFFYVIAFSIKTPISVILMFSTLSNSFIA